jgi:hypothetical protein
VCADAADGTLCGALEVHQHLTSISRTVDAECHVHGTPESRETDFRIPDGLGNAGVVQSERVLHNFCTTNPQASVSSPCVAAIHAPFQKQPPAVGQCLLTASILLLDY